MAAPNQDLDSIGNAGNAFQHPPIYGFSAAVANERQMGDFLGMGGYGAYVWPAYLVSAVTLAGLVFFTLRRAARARARLRALETGTPDAANE